MLNNQKKSETNFSQKRFDVGGKTGRGFEGRMEDFENDYNETPEKQSITPQQAEIIDQTMSIGQKLLDRDLLPELLSAEGDNIIKPYLSDYQHLNLYKLGWRLQFGISKAWAGLCSAQEHKKEELGNLSKNRNIYLSIDFVKHTENWLSLKLKEVMLHEMAHAVVFEIFRHSNPSRWSEFKSIDPADGKTEGHGRAWAAVCHAISGNACDQFYNNAIMAESFSNYKYECDFCGFSKYGKSIDFARHCGRCSKSVIVEENEE